MTEGKMQKFRVLLKSEKSFECNATDYDIDAYGRINFNREDEPWASVAAGSWDVITKLDESTQ